MNLLEEIKKRLALTGEYHDSLLLGLAEDVKQYMLSAGVEQSVVDSKLSIGCIARGVQDLWTKESFSDIFKQRVIQLTFEPETDLELIPDLPVADSEEGDAEDVSHSSDI